VKSTQATFEGEHILLLPPGLTGSVTLDDGTVVDLGPGHQVVVELDSHEQAKEVALIASKLAAEDDTVTAVPEHDEAQSRKNLGLPKKKGN
jgi:hypothetical protein